MATEALKSNPIVNLDAFPIVANAVGEGAPGIMRTVNGHVAATTGVTLGSTYRLARFPTTAKVKQVLLTNAALSTSAAADIDVAFSDSLTDGTQFQFSSLANPVVQTTGPADNKLFGAAQSLVSAGKNTDVTFAGTFTTDHQNIPMWQVLVNLGTTQFAADPGGYFDLMLKTTTTVTAGGDVALEIRYVGAN